MFFTFFRNFNFQVQYWGKRAKHGLKWQKIVCCTPYLSKHTSYDCVYCWTSLKWWHLQMHLHISKMTKKFCLTLYLIWLWFLVHMCKMMISPAIFSHFFKILIFLVFQSYQWMPRGNSEVCPIFFTCVWFFSLTEAEPLKIPHFHWRIKTGTLWYMKVILTSLMKNLFIVK